MTPREAPGCPVCKTRLSKYVFRADGGRLRIFKCTHCKELLTEEELSTAIRIPVKALREVKAVG